MKITFCNSAFKYVGASLMIALASSASAAETTPYSYIDTNKANDVEVLTTPASQTALNEAYKAVFEALRIHNQKTAFDQMADGYNTAQEMRDEWNKTEVLAVKTLAGFAAELKELYTDYDLAAKNMQANAYSMVAADWSDSISRSSQLKIMAGKFPALAVKNKAKWATYRCRNISQGHNEVTVTCEDRLEDAVQKNISDVVETRKQADWYYQFEVEGAMLQAQLAQQMDASSQVIGLNLEDNTLVANAINAQTAIAKNALIPENIATYSGDDETLSKTLATTLAAIEADTEYNFYIPFEPSIGAVETGSFIDAQTTAAIVE
jgi:hypothetical protein